MNSPITQIFINKFELKIAILKKRKVVSNPGFPNPFRSWSREFFISHCVCRSSSVYKLPLKTVADVT